MLRTDENQNNEVTNLDLAENERKRKKKGKASAKTWVNLFEKNRSGTNGMPLNYITPTIKNGKYIAKLEENEVAKETRKQKNALIKYVIRQNLGYNAMMRYINQNQKEIYAWGGVFHYSISLAT